MLDHKIVVGSFHKTGTVLLNRLFANICRRLELGYRHGRLAKGPEALTVGQRERLARRPERASLGLGEQWDIAFAPRADFAALTAGHSVRGLVALRDPRDVVISGAHYHMKARERWLHVKQPAFGDRTYQEAINALPDDAARYLFEMDNSAKKTIRAMLRWADPPDNFCVTRLEVLATDYEFEEFRRIFTFLGFEGKELKACLKVAREVSLFSRDEVLAERASKRARLAKDGIEPRLVAGTTPAAVPDGREAARERKQAAKVHTRSGGRPEQWRSHFSPAVLAAFIERFGDAPERLGYPPATGSTTVVPAQVVERAA